jgi:small-conductance mechanosensitive channel
MVAEGIVVLFKEFGDNALVFDVEFWIEIASERDKRKIESDVRFKIDELAQAARLRIAYPQRDVHLDAAGPLSVRILPPSS